MGEGSMGSQAVLNPRQTWRQGKDGSITSVSFTDDMGKADLESSCRRSPVTVPGTLQSGLVTRGSTFGKGRAHPERLGGRHQQYNRSVYGPTFAVGSLRLRALSKVSRYIRDIAQK